MFDKDNMPEFFWRVKTVRRIDDQPHLYIQTSIDHIYLDIDDAMVQVYKRSQDKENLEIALIREPMTERIRLMYCGPKIEA